LLVHGGTAEEAAEKLAPAQKKCDLSGYKAVVEKSQLSQRWTAAPPKIKGATDFLCIGNSNAQVLPLRLRSGSGWQPGGGGSRTWGGRGIPLIAKNAMSGAPGRALPKTYFW